MIFLSVLIPFLAGVMCMLLVSRKFSLAEISGMSFPLGIAAVTLVLFLFDNLFGVGLKFQTTLLISTLLLVILIGFYVRRSRGLGKILHIDRKAIIAKLRDINPVFWVFLVTIIYFFYAIAAKALYWPTFHYDSLTAYDFLGKVIANEGSFKNSIFTETPRYISYRTTYTPLFPVAMAYFQILGLETAKIIQPLFLFSILTSLYGLLRRVATPTASIFGVLLLATVPEFMAQSALQMTNMPTTFFIGTGVIAIYLWYLDKDTHYYWLACLLLFCGSWGRLEVIVFIVGIGTLVLYRMFLMKKELVLFSKNNILMSALLGLPSLVLYFLWDRFLKYSLNNANEFSQPIKLGVIELEGKFSYMMNLVMKNTLNTQLYGLVIYMFIAISVLTLAYPLLAGKKTRSDIIMPILLSILLTWGLYILVYYQIDVKGGLNGVDTYINHGYKRGLFGFLPLMVFGIICSPLSNRFFSWLELRT